MNLFFIVIQLSQTQPKQEINNIFKHQHFLLLPSDVDLTMNTMRYANNLLVIRPNY